MARSSSRSQLIKWSFEVFGEKRKPHRDRSQGHGVSRVLIDRSQREVYVFLYADNWLETEKLVTKGVYASYYQARTLLSVALNLPPVDLWLMWGRYDHVNEGSAQIETQSYGFCEQTNIMQLVFRNPPHPLVH